MIGSPSLSYPVAGREDRVAELSSGGLRRQRPGLHLRRGEIGPGEVDPRVHRADHRQGTRPQAALVGAPEPLEGVARRLVRHVGREAEQTERVRHLLLVGGPHEDREVTREGATTARAAAADQPLGEVLGRRGREHPGPHAVPRVEHLDDGGDARVLELGHERGHLLLGEGGGVGLRRARRERELGFAVRRELAAVLGELRLEEVDVEALFATLVEDAEAAGLVLHRVAAVFGLLARRVTCRRTRPRSRRPRATRPSGAAAARRPCPARAGRPSARPRSRR